MEISTETIAAMGAGWIVPDSGVTYLFNYTAQNDWALVVPEIRDPMLHRLLRLAEETSEAVDWRILHASEIDVSAGKFLTPAAALPINIFGDPWDYARSGVADLRSVLQREADRAYENPVDLGEMFRAGLARPDYGTASSFTRYERAGSARSYTFHFGEEDEQRVMTVRAPLFQAMLKLGLRLTAPRARPDGDSKVPRILAEAIDEDSYAFGYLTPGSSSGLFKAPNGSRLYADAAEICWDTCAETLDFLAQPGNFRLDELDLSLEELLESGRRRAYSNQTLRRAISVLRWQGFEEDEIEELYESMRGDYVRSVAQALLAKHQQLQKEAPDSRDLKRVEEQLLKVSGRYFDICPETLQII